LTLYQNKYRVEPTRLCDWDYRTRGWYFVTICSHNRTHIFGEVVHGHVELSMLGLIATSELQNLPAHYSNVQIDASVVMPNHLHALIMIDGQHCFSPRVSTMPSIETAPSGCSSPRPGSLSSVVRSYKAGVTRRGRESGLTLPVWQPRFHDHILRGDGTIAAVRDYIRNNPANWAKDKENPS
jgi:putative transposase